MSDSPDLQKALLRAAFAPMEQAAPAWAHWQSASGWEQHVDFASYLLLPHVYHNLGGYGVDDALFTRLKGIVKRNWAANAATLAAISRATDTLESAGIVSMLLPPCSLLLHDRSVALEAGTPIIFQIARRDAQSAVRLLHNASWRSVSDGVPHWSLPGYIAAVSHINLRDGEGRLLDLRWHEAAQPVATGGTVHAVHGRALRSPGVRASVHLLFSEARADSELSCVSRALLLLAKAPDPDGWRYLLEQLQQRDSALLDPVVELAPVNAMSREPATEQVVEPGAPAASAADGNQPSTFLRRLERPWRYYRSALGAQFSAAQALYYLPGYLLGKWQLQHAREILPRAYRALRYHWRQP